MNDLVIYGVLITIIALLIMIIFFQRSVMKLRIAMINNKVQLLERHLTQAQNDNSRVSEERDKYFERAHTAEAKLETLETIETKILRVLEPIKKQLARLDGNLGE